MACACDKLINDSSSHTVSPVGHWYVGWTALAHWRWTDAGALGPGVVSAHGLAGKSRNLSGILLFGGRCADCAVQLFQMNKGARKCALELFCMFWCISSFSGVFLLCYSLPRARERPSGSSGSPPVLLRFSSGSPPVLLRFLRFSSGSSGSPPVLLRFSSGSSPAFFPKILLWLL